MGKSKKLKRICNVCGKKITVIVLKDGSYIGGNIFGTAKDWNNNITEYWECNNCYEKT